MTITIKSYLFVFVPITLIVGETVVIRKCCTESQQLSENGKICIDSGRGGKSGWGHRADLLNVTSLWKGNGVPWWLSDGNTIAGENETSSSMLTFLEDAENTVVEFGAELPCSLKLTSSVPAKGGSLLHNGSLYFPSANILIQPGQYCADKLLKKDNQSHHVYLACAFHDAPRIPSCCSGNDIVVETYGKVNCLQREKTINSQYYWRGGDVSEQVWVWDVLYRWCYIDKFTDTYTHKDGIRFAYSSRTESIFSKYYAKPYFVEEADRHFGEKFCSSPYFNVSDEIEHKAWYFTSANLKESSNVKCGLALHIERTAAADGHGDVRIDYKYSVLRCPGQRISLVSEIIAKLMLYTGTFFVSIAVVTFIIVPESRNRKSTIVVCYAVCMLLNEVATLGYKRGKFSSVYQCYFIQFSFYYTNWAAAFNMNVLCFDIARTFRKLRTADKLKSQKNRKRMLCYMLYSWGFPLLLLFIQMAMVFTPGSPHSIYFAKDDYHFHCYLEGLWADWAYVHGPEVILTIFNVTFMVATVERICREMSKTSAINDTKARRRAACRKRFWILFNLSCMVGPSRLIALVVRYSISDPGDSFVTTSIVVNIVDSMRRLSIFIFVCCKKNVWKSIMQRLQQLRCNAFVLPRSKTNVQVCACHLMQTKTKIECTKL